MNIIMGEKKSRKAVIDGRAMFANIPRNWLHQALTYMDSGELVFRVVLELVEFLIVFIVLKQLMLGTNIAIIVLVSMIIVHTWNWVTNSMFWALILFAFPGMRNRGHDETCDYLNRMAERLKKCSAISGFAIFGSVARCKWHNRSDIDIRLIRNKGIVNWIISNIVMLRERMIAFVKIQPMDMYLADDVDYLTNLRNDEEPVFLIKRDSGLEDMYPNNEQIDFIKHLNTK